MRAPCYSQGQLRFGWALLLTLSLVWAQCLGPAHRLAHAPQGVASSVAAKQFAGAQMADGTRASASSFDGVFTGHGDQSPSCKLFDQLTHADALSAIPPAIVQPTPAAFTPSTPAPAWREASALPHCARGPPQHT
jgi:hypothetical protein